MPAYSKYSEIETRYGKPMKSILTDLFRSHITESAVADELGVSQSTVNQWLVKLRLKKQTLLVPDEQPVSVCILCGRATTPGIIRPDVISYTCDHCMTGWDVPVPPAAEPQTA
jgi:hypothetical protein